MKGKRSFHKQRQYLTECLLAREATSMQSLLSSCSGCGLLREMWLPLRKKGIVVDDLWALLTFPCDSQTWCLWVLLNPNIKFLGDDLLLPQTIPSPKLRADPVFPPVYRRKRCCGKPRSQSVTFQRMPICKTAASITRGSLAWNFFSISWSFLTFCD